MKIKATFDGIREMRKLQDLQKWYERGYDAETAGDEVDDAAQEKRATPDQQLAFRAGREDAATGRPMKGMLY